LSNPTCNIATLVVANPCLGGASLTIHNQKAAAIYFMAKELAAIGGTNYNSTLSTTLVDDAVQFGRTMSLDDQITAELGILSQNAVAAGATVATDPNQLMLAIACLKNCPIELNILRLLLMCKLGVHKSYPQ
jgi:hypothetical protein